MSRRSSFLENGLSAISALVAVTLYVSSLSLPAFECRNSAEGETGLAVLLVGWTGLFVFEFRWLANLLFPVLVVFQFLVSKVFTGRGRWYALLLPLVASWFALSSLLWRTPGCGTDAGVPVWAIGLGPGGRLWVAAIIVTSATYVIRVLFDADRNRYE